MHLKFFQVFIKFYHESYNYRDELWDCLILKIFVQVNNAGILGGTYHRDALVASLAAGVCSLIHTEERVEPHGDKPQ